MSLYTVNELQSKIATIIDHTVTAPGSSTDEFAWRLGFINRAYQEWATAYDWEALRKEVFLGVTGVSQASISLPADFRKMAMEPILYGDADINYAVSYPEIPPEDRKLYLDSDEYFYILGSRENQTMILNPATLASGASLLISYFSFPTSLVSSGDSTVISDPEFVVDRTIAYILQTRSDPRYQQIESSAREKLIQMVDNEKDKGLSMNNPVMTPEQRSGFRIGRD